VAPRDKDAPSSLPNNACLRNQLPDVGASTHNMGIDVCYHRTVGVAYVRVMLSYLRSLGIDPARVYDADALARIECADPMSRYALSEWREVMSKAQACTGQRDLIPGMSQHFQPWHAGVIGLTVMTSRSIYHLGCALARFHHLLNDVHRVELGIHDDQFFLRLDPVTPEDSDRLARLSLTAWVQSLRWLTGRHDLCFDGRFTGPAPQDVTPYQRIFGGTVKFEQTENSMWGALPYIHLPLIPQDASVHSMLHDQALEQLETMAQGASRFVAKLESLVKRHLDSGHATLDMLAADLNMPSRTLQRRLDGLDLTFRKLVERVRKIQAIGYLQDTRMPLGDIATTLGFANQGTFNRAFKRWTGRSPGEYRHRHKRGEQPDVHLQTDPA
jgi:AraC-like DNA-binding protein